MNEKLSDQCAMDAPRQSTLAERVRQEARFLRDKAHVLEKAADLFERLPKIIGAEGQESLQAWLDFLSERRHF